MEFDRQIGQDKGVRVLGPHEIAPFFGQVGVMALFVHGEEKLLLLGVKGILGLIGVQLQFGLVHEALVLRVLQHLEKIGRAGTARLDAKEQQADSGFQLLRVGGIGAVGRVQLFDQILRLGKEAGAELLLGADQRFDGGFELVVLVVNHQHRRAADDQRGARFVNEDGVHFVHNGEIMAALHLFLAAHGHAVVAQVIEAEFGVGAVGDVAVVLLAPHGGGLVAQDAADGQAQKPIDRPHPFAVARRQIIVDGDDMDAAAGQGVEINRHGGDERFAFAGRHFRDLALVQGDAAHQLHVEGDHLPFEGMFAHDDFRAAEAAAGVFDDGVGFGQNIIQPRGQFLRILDLGASSAFHCAVFWRKTSSGCDCRGGFVLVDLLDQRPQLFTSRSFFEPTIFLMIYLIIPASTGSLSTDSCRPDTPDAFGPVNRAWKSYGKTGEASKN